MDTKTCSKCNVTKDKEQFTLRKDTNKLRNICKECKRLHQKEYIQSTNYKKGDKRLEQRRNQNVTEVKQCSCCSVKKALSEFNYRTDSKTYRNQCKACRNDYVKDVKKQDKHRIKANERARNRRKTDPCFLINQRLRARLSKVLASKKATRQSAFYDLIGCSINEFKRHIEKQFVDNMSWELKNFELDHIIPCAFFDLTDVCEQKKCFHYSNFQPLTHDANNAKRDYILEQNMEYLFSIMF